MMADPHRLIRGAISPTLRSSWKSTEKRKWLTKYPTFLFLALYGLYASFPLNKRTGPLIPLLCGSLICGIRNGASTSFFHWNNSLFLAVLYRQELAVEPNEEWSARAAEVERTRNKTWLSTLTRQSFRETMNLPSCFAYSFHFVNYCAILRRTCTSTRWMQEHRRAELKEKASRNSISSS